MEDDFFALKEDDLKIKPSVVHVQIDVAKLNQCTSYCIFRGTYASEILVDHDLMYNALHVARTD